MKDRLRYHHQIFNELLLSQSRRSHKLEGHFCHLIFTEKSKGSYNNSIRMHLHTLIRGRRGLKVDYLQTESIKSFPYTKFLSIKKTIKRYQYSTLVLCGGSMEARHTPRQSQIVQHYIKQIGYAVLSKSK